MSRDSTLEAGAKAPLPPIDKDVLESIFGTSKSPKIVSPDRVAFSNELGTRDKNQENNNRPTRTGDVSAQPMLPLLKMETGTPSPPLASPEVTDLDKKPTDPNVDVFNGIDDGLLKPIDQTTDIFDNDDKDSKHGDMSDTQDEGVGTEDGKLWMGDEADGPVVEITDRIGEAPLIPDVNTYQQKKNLAQGMMDLALLSANANQLRYVIESSSSGHPYYYSSIIFISLSIILQIAVGVGLILNSRYDVKDDKDICKADKINNMTVLGIFLITIVNVFISSFSVAPSSTGMAVVVQQAG